MFKFFKKSLFAKKLRAIFKRSIDEHTLEELEELFYESDLGTDLASDLTEKVHQIFRKNPSITSEQIIDVLKGEMVEKLALPPNPPPATAPYVVMIVGVNGNGKTTSIAKLAHLYQKMGKSVLLAAADTFRAAAIEQLDKWAHKAGCQIVKGKFGADPASVVFDALEAAKSRQVDIVLVDTAGRLHTKTDLMKELEKLRRVSGKSLENAPHETLLVLDATVGQNGIEQAKIFNEYTPLSGLILTKLDGTAKGGAAIAIQKQLNLPIKYIGTGEKVEDFSAFNAREFVDALFA